jgi:hypothetical protein
MLVVLAFSAFGVGTPAIGSPAQKSGAWVNVRASEGGFAANETPIIVSPVDARDVMTGANDGNCRGSGTAFYTSSDGGDTFRTHCFPSVGEGGCGDPTVAYDLHGTAFVAAISDCTHLSGAIYLQHSSDNGRTWSRARRVVPPSYRGGLTDKDWLEIDTTRTSPRAGTMYISTTQLNHALRRMFIAVSRSTDGGRTWKTAQVNSEYVFPEQVEWSDLAIDGDGNVYVTWLHCMGAGKRGFCAGTKGDLELSRSTDGGKTWSRPVTVAVAQLAPAGRTCFYGCLPNTIEDLSEIPVIAADTSGGVHRGNLYVAFYEDAGRWLRVLVTTSTDGGRTWGTPVRVAPRGTRGDEFFPWLSVGPFGTVGVSWMDRRDDPANLRYAEYATFSSSGGARFGTDRRIATGLSNPNNDGTGGFFMGDYTGNAWGPDGKFYAAWMDTRNRRSAQAFVGFRRSG